MVPVHVPPPDGPVRVTAPVLVPLTSVGIDHPTVTEAMPEASVTLTVIVDEAGEHP